MPYRHTPHPHIEARKVAGAPKAADHRGTSINSRIGVRITLLVGTMGCAYAFTALALISLPAAIGSGQTIILVAWIAQTLLQLVLLPIIIVGQNQQAQAADARAQATFNDAEAVLAECLELQRHLQSQDRLLATLVPPATAAR
ncbi:MAG: hypothetical protein NVSMB18_36430 [Acetobacteraceae bacterium]